MFEVLVYLYEMYSYPEACPNSVVLTKKLSAIGFEEDEISQALNWLAKLAVAVQDLKNKPAENSQDIFGTRIYTTQEFDGLGVKVVGFLQLLETAQVINSVQREIVIEQAFAVQETPVSIDELKIIVLMVLWSQEQEPNPLMFDELFLDEDDQEAHSLH